jgi:diguanylate cyclase (GGDEF)-like protein/PAS domain S-box-containing protein
LSEFDNPEIYRFVLESLPTGVYVVDRNRRILFWNAGAERICGYLRQDVVGRFLREHLLATSEEAEVANGEEYDPLNLVLRDGKSSTAHVSILHKEGYRIPIILQTVPIRDERGTVIGAAECFEQNLSASERTRRKTAPGRLVCLDEVTGLPSKSSMEADLREHLTVFAERHADFGILLIEVDQLDLLRATRGPSVVPSILRVVSHSIENCLRPTDVVGAWSNHRFLAVLAECREADLEAVANRIRKMIGQSEVEWWGDRFAVTAALGGAGCRAEDTLELLVERSEQSLLESASAGGNRVTVVS